MKFLKLAFMVIWTKITEFIFRVSHKDEKNNFLKEKKILLIKPYYYLDLYTENSDQKIDIIMSSFYRLGPVGLFSDLNSDFLITNSEINDLNKIRINKRLITSENKALFELQKSKSINLDKINFSDYDIVLSYEGAVSSKFINKYKNIKWGLILEDHSQKNYKKNCLKKPKDFDFFLNLTQGFTLYSLIRGKHCIDFSYTFGSSNFMKNMKLEKKNDVDILIEIQQPNEVKKFLNFKNMKVEKLEGNLKIKDYLNKLSTSKIFFCPLFTTPRWGNSIIEAALCKCLIIGNKYSYWNSLLIHKDLHCTTVKDGKKIIKKIFENQKLFKYYLDEQNKKLDLINYNLPLNQIQNLLS